MTATFASVSVGIAAAGGVLAVWASGRNARRTQIGARVVGHLANVRNGVTPRRALRSLWREPPDWLVRSLAEIETPLRAADAWRWWRLALVVASVAGLLVGVPVLSLLGVALVAGAPLGAVALWRSRQTAAYDTALASALDALARGVRSGGSLSAAIAEAGVAVRGAVASDIQRVAASVERGQPLTVALDDWSNRRARGSVRLAVGALVLASESGGPPARVVEEVAGAVRARLQVEGEAHALAAQARLSAMVVGLAPLGFLALTSATDQRNVHMLFGTPIGVTCLVLGLSLDAIGAVWMHRISESVLW